MSRLERLVNLTAALLNAEVPLSAEELRKRVTGYPAEKLPFKRQFERDKDALRELGLPLVMLDSTTELPVRYKVDVERYYLKDPGLTPEELTALTMAAEVVKLNGLGDERLTDSIWKLESRRKGATPGAITREPDTDLSRLEAELPANSTLATIFDGIASGRMLRFEYRDAVRSVMPRSLAMEKGRWYLAAYDLDRNDERSFRIDRMSGDVSLGETPKRGLVPAAPIRTSPSRTPWELAEDEPIISVVHVLSAHAMWAEQHVGTEAVVKRHVDGAIDIQLNVRNRDAFRSFVLGFLDGAVVLSPPELRVEIAQWLRAKSKSSGAS